MDAFSKLGEAITSSFIYRDFMQREGLILVVVVGGYLFTSKYNRILDELDKENALKNKAEKKAKRKA